MGYVYSEGRGCLQVRLPVVSSDPLIKVYSMPSSVVDFEGSFRCEEELHRRVFIYA